MKKTVLFFGMLLINLHLFSQNVNVDKIKQENLKLKNQVSNLQKENDSIRKVTIALKQDTTFLRKEILLCSLYSQASKTETTNTNNNFKFSFISCKGNRAAQQVIVSFLIEHNLPNQDFGINKYDYGKGNAYDSQGNNFPVNATTVGGTDGAYIKIPTGVPVKITLIFNNILPGNDFFRAVNMVYNSSNLDDTNRQKGIIEFRNLKITWE